MIKAVYIHIPFCKNICSYCDFSKFYYNSNLVDEYLTSLDKEIKKRYKNEVISSIYIGGGTPSVLNTYEIEKLFDILKQIKRSKNIEITFEINFDSINKEKLLLLKKNGVNRLSFGTSSINKDNLSLMNRSDNKEDIIKTIRIAKELGFNNINVDLIYALPNESMNVLKKDLEFLLSLDIEHISTYSLILEKNTVLYLKNIKNIDENLEIKMYNYICNTLKDNNFIHYEISNFAKSKKESRHNLVYWNNEEYYGFGLSSASYIGNYRITNTKSINNYIKGKRIIEKEKLSISDKMEYEVILNFRKIKGINKKDFYKKYKKDFCDIYNIGKLLDSNYLKEDNSFIFIPEDKLYISNEIIVEVLRSRV